MTAGMTRRLVAVGVIVAAALLVLLLTRMSAPGDPLGSPEPSVVRSNGPAPATVVPSPTPTSVAPTPTPAPTPIPVQFSGFIPDELLPSGWSSLRDIEGLNDIPTVNAHVYGPDGESVPPSEGPGRVAIYETFPESSSYLDSRIERSRDRGGHPIAVDVNGVPAEVWVDEETGELVLGWTLRGQSEVLVANTADYTVEMLVQAAENLGECCG